MKTFFKSAAFPVQDLRTGIWTGVGLSLQHQVDGEVEGGRGQQEGQDVEPRPRGSTSMPTNDHRLRQRLKHSFGRLKWNIR